MNQSNHTTQSERVGKAIAIDIITAVTALTALASYLPSCWIDDADICYGKEHKLPLKWRDTIRGGVVTIVVSFPRIFIAPP